MINANAAVGFERGAADYERARPSYPSAVLDALPRDGRIVDLAAGTGKLTRLLPGHVIAVEPVAAMRAIAAQFAPTIAATAERIPLRDGCADAVTIAQAFHWFDATRALEELARVLRPGGTLLLVWNDRDLRVPWMQAYSEIVHAHDPGTAYEGDVDYAPPVADNGRFTPLERTDVDNPQRDVTTDIVVERALSTSYIAAGADVQEQVARDVRALVRDFEEPFDLPYVTHIYTCTRC